MYGVADSHDVRDADRARPAEREAVAAFALQADHVGIAVAIDLNASGKEFVSDEIFVRWRTSTCIIGAPTGRAEIHEGLHVIVGDLGPADHPVLGRGFRQAHRQIGDVD